MFEIVRAIKTKFDATTALTTAMTGGMHFRKRVRQKGEATTPMPYAVYNVDADAPQENTGAGYVQKVRVTWEVYAKKASDFETAAEAIRDNFFRKPLTLEAGRIIDAAMTDEGLDDLETDDATQPQTFYQIVIEYTQTQTRA
jgi:hypothetical protein